ncbi:MAG: histidinol-phosphatase [Rhodospirillales bacterium RIFCSPLOWO2_12_FULL_58_28]|nr:MAG: histidinol-phosphatase [Rhodospirillales bacterium RIFCSPLOWO2_12_FULL_58_28]
MIMADSRLDEFIEWAGRMADAAAPVAMKYFRSGVAIDRKADLSPVTAADREAESAMRAVIGEAFPDHGVIGEEHGKIRADAEYVWVLDPIDGTKSFVTGKPLFGTLIALTRNGKPIVGVIDMPALKERWTGAEGRPTLYNDRPVKARPCSDMAEAWLYATSPQMFTGDDFRAFERLREKSRSAVYGADCYAYGLLANGTVDIVCEAGLQPYDFCALSPVIKGAGGVFTDWQGEELTIRSNGRVLAAGDRKIHAQALEALAG